MLKEREERELGENIPGKQVLRLISHSLGLAVGLGLGAVAEVAKKSLLGGYLQSGE